MNIRTRIGTSALNRARVKKKKKKRREKLRIGVKQLTMRAVIGKRAMNRVVACACQIV